ncbi:DUF3106 domain-containing protein [Luteimonas sp. MJ293]|uniref:DUF3106 domain-containing protein n=1 Tax=Luteimonas sp. MJ146 TaxID=3129240 RepID=UPI0031BB3BB7
MRIPTLAAVPTLAMALALGLAGLAGPAQAQTSQELPEWDQLTSQQREALITTVRDRWNDAPAQRARMLRHAERWQQMSPEERQRAHHGMKRWRDMSPESREEARALYQRMRTMPEAERRALHERWKDMTPDQRREWLEQNPPRR